MPTTQVSSHTVYYDDCGTGHPLLLISGLGTVRQGWWKQIEPLSARYHVINMDNRDAGDSALGTGSYTIADMAEDVAGVIQNLRLGPTHVVGISMGGMITQELATRHPELVDQLVLVSTTAGGPTSVNAKPEIAALLMLAGEDIETRVRRTFTAITIRSFHTRTANIWPHTSRARDSRPIRALDTSRRLRRLSDSIAR